MSTADDQQSPRPSPYATGGGGTVLEHRYGAVLLAHLLTGDPVPALGDDATPVWVRFQASAHSPVDDLVVAGSASNGGERWLSIGVRRQPQLVTSDRKSVSLLARFLRVVADEWEHVDSGRWRLALAVLSSNPAVRQVRKLITIARATDDEPAFRAEVARPEATNDSVRRRLEHLDRLVEPAAQEAGVHGGPGPGVLLWRLLGALWLPELRLEGPDESDRTTAVGRLRAVTRDGTVAAADDLFARLAELSDRYAPSGAHVTESMLRRDLSGIPLRRSPSREQAWRVLDGLTQRLRDRTRFTLAEAHTELEFERAEARNDLATKMTAAATGPSTLVVRGEPDVGKSALTLRVAEQLDDAGVAATIMSLRDVPDSSLRFEAEIGGRLEEVLGATATGTGRLLVLDGAESVLEGRRQLLAEIAVGALRAGLGVVAVTRSDGSRAVHEALEQAVAAAGTGGEPGDHEVPRLTAAEVRSMRESFASLARLTSESRTAGLLSRPGLADLLLRAGPSAEVSAEMLSEADLFAAVWDRLVRRTEARSPGGPSPDAREQALTCLARRQLLPDAANQPPNADALPSLRSDGLLLPPGPTSAWNPGDEFASDLMRDIAVARLLITDGWEVLDEAGGPRWALRATRLACQSALTRAPDREVTRTHLQEVFDDIASRHGSRWAEVPLEALLTMGSAEDLLAAVWTELLEDEHEGLRTVLRLAVHRYTERGFGDPVVLAPLVKLAYCGEEDLGQDDRHNRRTGEQVRAVVLAWLRGLAGTDSGPHTLRQQVRDRILETDPPQSDEFAVEALAMLGPDLDNRAEVFLRNLAEDGGAHLATAVESTAPILAMSMHQPELILSLTEAFYIKPPRADSHDGSLGLLDRGIRRHEHAGGFGVPMSAWHFGPFYTLLRNRTAEALALINHLLDHAAAVRAVRTSTVGVDDSTTAEELPGLDLDLPGVGRRRCVGDGQTWSWYRGSSTGPDACVSALLAVERFADELVEVAGVPLDRVSEVLLRDSHNLAMPGLVVGLLVRHLDDAGDLMDRWLVRPELWRLESARVASEGVIHIQGPDDAAVPGRERRTDTFHNVAAELTIKAKMSGDDERLAVLAAIGDELVANARAELNDSQDETAELVSVEQWAAAFRPENYQARQTEDGNVIQFVPPDDIASRLAPTWEALARGQDAWRLERTYAEPQDRAAPVDTLAEDLAIGRDLAEDPPGYGPLHPEDAPAAVASAAIIAHADGRITLPADDLGWAIDLLVEASHNPHDDEFSDDNTIHPTCADRSAAAALPALLLPRLDEIGPNRDRVHASMRRCATSVFDEVRMCLAVGLTSLWQAPCDPPQTHPCRHVGAWTALKASLADSRLGDWDPETQRRVRSNLPGPYEKTLPEVPTDRLLANRLIAPLIATAGAARSDSCVAGDAQALLTVLLDADRRSWGHWAQEGYGRHVDRRRSPVLRLLIEFAAAGDHSTVTDYVVAFASNAAAMDQLLHGLSVVLTYDETLRDALSEVWPHVMGAALDAVEAGAELAGDRNWSDRAIAGLLPTPQLDAADSDPDGTLERAWHTWIHPDEIGELVERWIPIARKKPRTVDAVAQLARCADPSWQATTGLSWTERLIAHDYAAVADRCYFLGQWLSDVRSAAALDSEQLARWRRLVDGLAAEGDGRAVRLQQAEE